MEMEMRGEEHPLCCLRVLRVLCGCFGSFVLCGDRSFTEPGLAAGAPGNRAVSSPSARPKNWRPHLRHSILSSIL